MSIQLKLLSIFLWLFFGVYFFIIQPESGILFFTLTLVLGPILLLSIINKEISLTVFLALSFFAIAITPSFFFVNKDDYRYDGFSAIKDFKFELLETYFILLYPIIFLFLTFLFTSILNKIFIKNRLKNINFLGANTTSNDLLIVKNSGPKSRIDAFLLPSFIFVVAIPLIFFMYSNLETKNTI